MTIVNIIVMELIHKGPVWICCNCKSLLAGEANQEVEVTGKLGSYEQIDQGFTCLVCDWFNIIESREHPDVHARRIRRISIGRPVETEIALMEKRLENLKKMQALHNK